MKYVISWNERPQGTPIEYENAQKRILEVFHQWKAPANFKIEFFVVRVGDWGGYMMVDCDDPLTVHKFCSTLPSFVFEARPVVSVMDALACSTFLERRYKPVKGGGWLDDATGRYAGKPKAFSAAIRAKAGLRLSGHPLYRYDPGLARPPRHVGHHAAGAQTLPGRPTRQLVR